MSASLPSHTLDLGELGGTVLVCGGIYGNLEALDALLAEAGRLGVPFTRIIHTGDVAAYCADARACAERIAELGLHAIRGNVEEQLAVGAADCACGFEEGSACADLSEAWYAHALSEMTPELQAWMAALPAHLVFTMGGVPFRVVHGGVGEISRFLFASAPASAFRDEFALAQADVVIAGHSGVPFTRSFGHRLWHNTGALGLPANDGTQRVWYTLVRAEIDRVVFEHVPLTYDYRTAAAKVRRAGLPEGYARCLETGLWPSLDVMPRAERAARGRPITAGMHVLPLALSSAAQFDG